MTECRRISEQLTPYADGNLDQSARADVDRHLEACPACRATARASQQGRAILQARASQLRDVPLPPGLRSRCQALLNEHSADQALREHSAGPAAVQPHWTRRLVPVAIASLLLVFTGAALLSLLTSRSDALLAAQLTADHSRCFRNFVADDAPGIEASAAERTLATFGFAVDVPPSSTDAGVELVHVRRCLSAYGGVPHVLYRVNDMDLSLYVFDDGQRVRQGGLDEGHQSRVWSRGETTFVAVFPAGIPEVGRAVDYLMQQTS